MAFAEPEDAAPWIEAEDEASVRGSSRDWIVPGLALAAVAVWTGFFIWARAGRIDLGRMAPADWAAEVSAWTGPVLLIGLGWLMAMRNSRREANRFGDSARLLADESARLEARLVIVNRELSLAREFLAAQSRELESVGRIAAERLSHNAERLQDLVRDNGNRIESLGAVSEAALDNMEKLRGQLPVIASSAKDVTNNIGNAGRTAHAQLEEMVSGFKRLNEVGQDCTREVGLVREAAGATIAEFEHHCQQLEAIARARFEVLNARGAEFRTQLDTHEIEALAAIRSRAGALAEELNETRQKLDTEEAERLTSLRARLSALREESTAVGRSLRDGEARALAAWQANLGAFEADHARIAASLRDAGDTLAESARVRVREIEDEAARMMSGFTDSHRAFATQLDTLRDSARDGNRALVDDLSARLDALAAQAADHTRRLDAELTRHHATAQDRHEQTLTALTVQFDALDAEVTQKSAAVLAQVERQQDRIDARHARLVTELTDRIAALDAEITQRMERQDERTQVLSREAGRLTLTLEGYERQLSDIAARSQAAQATVASSLGAIRSDSDEAHGLLSQTRDTLAELTDASMRLLETIRSSAEHGEADLPIALTRSEERLDAIRAGISTLRDALEDAAGRGDAIAGRIDHSGAGLQALIADLDALGSAFDDRNGRQEGAIAGLRGALADLDRESESLANKAQADLTGAIETLSAAVRAAVADIDQSGAAAVRALADRLGQETTEALEKVIRTKAAEASGQLEQAAAHAAGVSRESAAQFRDQLGKINNLVSNLEQRVAQARERAQEQVDNDFARRAALITESLNSHSIDIAKALSTEVSDTAWAAYLRGDRGIFTRRAVSLIDASEARAIQQTFERDTDFREHVSRYIHDFEAILRQVLSTRDGNALGVTLLSSDMGKLYVALAQAIHRLRS